MTLPDTYACGQTNLPLQVAKIARLAESTDSEPERMAAIHKLWRLGYFLDCVNILWPKVSVPDFAQDSLYNGLKGPNQ